MKLRTLIITVLALAALASGAVAAVTVSGNLGKSQQSAAKAQYCPPASQSGQGKPNNHGKGKKCGQQGGGGQGNPAR